MRRLNRMPESISLLELLRGATCVVGRKKSYAELRKGFMNAFKFEDFEIVDSGRHALLLALLQTPSDKNEVITPAYGCPILSVAIRKAGKVPVFVDIEKETFSLNIDQVLAKVTSRTAAVIVVHEFGNPVPREKLIKLRNSFSGVIIEDAAIALGSKYSDGTLAGQVGDFTVFSGGLGKPVSANSWGGLGAKSSRIKKVIDIKGTRSSMIAFARMLFYLLIRNQCVYVLAKRFIDKAVVADSLLLEDEVYSPSDLDNTIMFHKWSKLDRFQHERYELGEKLRELMEEFQIATICNNGNYPCYSRIPLRFSSEFANRRAINVFSKQGIELSRPYQRRLCDSGERFQITDKTIEQTAALTLKKGKTLLRNTRKALQALSVCCRSVEQV